MDEIPKFEDTEPVNESGSSSSEPTPPAFEDTEPVSPSSYLDTLENQQNPIEATPLQKGLLEKVGHGFAGPFFTGAEQGLNKLGVSGFSPEEIKAREQAVPSTLGTAAELSGLGASAFTGPLAVVGKGIEGAMSAAGLMKTAAELGSEVTPIMQAGRAALKAAGEMFYLGAANDFDKQIIGDINPEAPVSHALAAGVSEMPLGFFTGGVFSYGGSKAGAYLKRISDSKIGTAAKEFLEDLGNAVNKNATEFGETPSTINPATGVQPSSIADLETRIAKSPAGVELPALPQLKSALSRVPLDNPVHPLQEQSLMSKADLDKYQTMKEMPGEAGKLLQDYESIQKQELLSKTDDAIKDVAGTPKVTSNKIEGGNQASKYFTDQYQAEKSAAGKLVEQAKSMDTEGFDHKSGVLDAMKDSVPGVSKMLSNEGEVLPYKTSMGLSKQTYNAVKDAVTSLKENPTSFSDLFNIRKGLENGVNMFTADASTQSEIRSLKASMMDYMQNMASPDLREGFKRYAINEAQREVIENTFGASVGNKQYGQISKITPETIINDMFADSATINAAKSILPKEQYNHLLGNWISQARSAATDAETNAFSSRKFASFLTKNAPELQTAFADNPEGLQKLKDLTTIMKIIPDATSVNPSGTAKTLAGFLKGSKTFSEAGLNTLKYLKDFAVGKVEQQRNLREINKALEGMKEDPKSSVNGLMDALSKKIGHPIKDHAIPFVLKTLDSGPEGLGEALRYADTVHRGDTGMKLGVNSLFTGAKLGTYHLFNKSDDKDKEKIRKFIEDGGVNKQIQNSLQNSNPANQNSVPNFADGGEVNDTSAKDPESKIPQIFPNQSMLLSQAKGRVSSYLNSVRPIDTLPALPFDKTNKDPEKEKSYDKALNLANKPLSILKHIQDGTLDFEHMGHFKKMWPEIHNELSQKITERMTKAQIDKEKMPPYHVRQGLASFLGTPLDSTMTQSSIQAAQSVFKVQQMANQQLAASKPKKNTSKLTEMGLQHQTPEQASELRQATAKR